MTRTAATIRRHPALAEEAAPAACRPRRQPPWGWVAGAEPASREEVIATAKRAMAPVTKAVRVWHNGTMREICVTRAGVGPIVTPFGRFWVQKYQVNDPWRDYLLILNARLDHSLNPRFSHPERVHLRLDSGCYTSLFMDLTCDCRQQLHRSMQAIQAVGEGAVLHIPKQDGRGKDLPFKLSTLMLQDECGMDTVEAAEALACGGAIDVRDYVGATAILKFIGLAPAKTRLAVMTNNPKKLEVLEENGFGLERAALVIPATSHTRRHFEAKQRKLGHYDLVPALEAAVAR